MLLAAGGNQGLVQALQREQGGIDKGGSQRRHARAHQVVQHVAHALARVCSHDAGLGKIGARQTRAACALSAHVKPRLRARFDQAAAFQHRIGLHDGALAQLLLLRRHPYGRQDVARAQGAIVDQLGDVLRNVHVFHRHLPPCCLPPRNCTSCLSIYLYLY